MSDLSFTYQDDFQTDLALIPDDLTLSNGLETAVIISLFTDQRVKPEELKLGDMGLRGWWGDSFNNMPIGSKLWLLQREKLCPETLHRAKDYAKQALQWLVSDGIATWVSVEVRVGNRENFLLTIKIHLAHDISVKTYSVLLPLTH